MTIVSPSILSADFTKLGADCQMVLDAGAQMLHYDVMDGHFVPNISFGVPVMSVEPGFGGQKFMPSALEKLRWLREERAKRSAHFLLEVDGGVDDTTAPLCVEAGADILVAGSAVFGAADPAAAVRRLAAL